MTGMSLSLASTLSQSALRYPERTAVVLEDQHICYRDLWEQARHYAAALSAQGIGAGDRVGMMVPNIPDFPRVYYAILALGAIVVPVHLLLVADEVEYVLRDSQATILIYSNAFNQGIKGARQCGVTAIDLDELQQLSAKHRPIATSIPREAMDDAVILYTSGTTGTPKGAVLSNVNLVLNAWIAAKDLFQFTQEDVFLACLPLFHSFGQTVMMNAAFCAGACLVLMPRFHGPTALNLLMSEGVTVFAGVPTMYIALIDAAKNDARRPRLRKAIAGGSSLLLATLAQFEELYGTPVYEGYGLSETSPVASFNQEVFGRRPGTVGCAIWGVDVRVARADVDDRIDFVADGEMGEIIIRGHCVFKGYLNQPQATAAAIVDGWFRSGDIGTRDVDGFITIVDRKKDMVLRGGYNVYPREVEEILIRHHAVKQVAVIGLPHAVHGEEVVAIVVREPEVTDIKPEELVNWSKQQLARYKYPRVVHFIDALPVGPTGKVLKRELVARYS